MRREKREAYVLSFPRLVERWRSVVQRVRPAGLPTDLILASIALESGGQAGLVARRSHASGLMQVKKSVVADYNRAHGTKIPFSRMREVSTEAAADQIRIGSALLAKHAKIFHDIDPIRAPWPSGDLTRWQAMAMDLSYTHGGPGFRRLRKRAIKAGFSDDPKGWQAYQQRYAPSFTSEMPWFHANSVWHLYQTGGGSRREALAWYRKQPGAVTRQPQRTITASVYRNDSLGGILLIGLIALAAFFSRKKK